MHVAGGQRPDAQFAAEQLPQRPVQLQIVDRHRDAGLAPLQPADAATAADRSPCIAEHEALVVGQESLRHLQRALQGAFASRPPAHAGQQQQEQQQYPRQPAQRADATLADRRSWCGVCHQNWNPIRRCRRSFCVFVP